MAHEPLTGPSGSWGLALSGGGSRAAAFHRGTLRGLIEVGLLDRVEVISTVSGGSVFAAAWMAARAKGTSDEDFLAAMRAQLAAGFVVPTLRRAGIGVARVLLPGTHLTTLLAEYFDAVLCEGLRLEDLPKRPRLCLNTAVMESAEVGKFTAEGFSVGTVRGDIAKGRAYPLGFAAAASAAFPIGLAPVAFDVARWMGPVDFPRERFAPGTTKLHLTDGGVLENLGFQTLWKSARFATRNFVVSDAGLREAPWAMRGAYETLKSIGAALLAPRVLTRVFAMTHNKQNRWARQMLYEVMDRSRLEADLSRGAQGPSARPRRRLMLIQVNQRMQDVLGGVPVWRLQELGRDAGIDDAPPPEGVSERDVAVRAFLVRVGLALDDVDALYKDFGGDEAERAVNTVGTAFSALSSTTLDALEQHAHWQVKLMHRLYGA